MPNRTNTKSGMLPLVDWFAGHISSPVLRLRFLRTAQRPPPRTYRRGWFRQFHSGILILLPVVLLLLTAPAAPRVRALPGLSLKLILPPSSAAVRVDQAPEVWQVEKTKDFETYSNGLRIDSRFSVANRRRSYIVFSATRPEDIRGERRTAPAGIVFHTTESQQAPFEPQQNATLDRIGESLLVYVQRRRSYNFVIDRFGRVYRVVPESDSANHAGYSIWSDARWVYLNLNESFLAVSFETETRPGQSDATVNPAQIRSGAMLTEMLRGRYGIPSEDCVTHAQVSVNETSLRIGYHLDWASSFPFDRIGLPDNYALPLPAITMFGFAYDAAFTRQAGARLSREAQLGEQSVLGQAIAAGVEPAVYRKTLQREYRIRLAAARHRKSQPEQEE